MKTVIVTGGAKGIGKATALKFAREGINVVINYRSAEPLELIEEIESLNVACMAYKADIADYNQAKGLITAAKERFGTIDYLINNAGVTKDNLLLRMSEQDFDSVIDTNLKGAFNTIRHVTGIMLKQKNGAIINISSVVGIFGNWGQANYAASKAGLTGLTKGAAQELGSRGITVNAIAPGFIETDMTASLSDEIRQKMLERISLNRFGTAQEVAELIYFIANCKYITGQIISIDGGM